MHRSRAGASGLFQSLSMVEDGPGVRASLISIGLHGIAAVALFVFLQFTIPVGPRKPLHVTMLHEAHLLAPPPVKSAVPSVKGADSGNQHPQLASKGELPKPANLRGPMPLRVSIPKPALAVSPVIDAPPPQIEQNFQYGNPLSQISGLSPGPGFNGIGSGVNPGAKGAAGDRFGRGLGTLFGKVVYRMSELSKVPVLLYKVAPDYSDEARAARCHGTVLLGVIIDETGRPRDVHVLKPLGLGLDEKAVEAVQHWRFSPGLKDGQPVCVAANVEVNFQLL